MKKKIPTACFEVVAAAGKSTGMELFVTLDGVRIAKRGQPGTPQARTWVSLEPGYRVYDQGRRGLTVELHGVPVN